MERLDAALYREMPGILLIFVYIARLRGRAIRRTVKTRLCAARAPAGSDVLELTLRRPPDSYHLRPAVAGLEHLEAAAVP